MEKNPWELIMLFLERQVWDWGSSTAHKAKGSLCAGCAVTRVLLGSHKAHCISASAYLGRFWVFLCFSHSEPWGVWLLLFLVHIDVFQSMIEIVCNCLEMDISFSVATRSYSVRVDFKYYFYWDQAAVHFKVDVFSQHGSHRIDLYIWADLPRSQNCLANHLPCKRLMMLFSYSN